MMKYLDYSSFINLVSNAKLQLLYSEYTDYYELYGIGSSFSLACLLAKDGGSDQTNFETNWKSQGNLPLSTQVTTQFEKRDKTIKLAHLSGSVQLDGTVTVSIKIPGTANPTGDTSLDGRWISGGIAFFDTQTPGDIVTSVKFIDIDNISGQGANTVVSSYTDDDLPIGNQGWIIPTERGFVQAEPIGGYGFAPAGYYIVVSGKKGSGITTGTFYVNLEWGKVEP